MRREIKELKRIARGNLTGNYMELIRAFVFCHIVTSLVELPFSMMTNSIEFSIQNITYYAATVIIGIASVVLTAGQYRIHLSIARNGKVHPADLFFPIKYHADRFIFTEMLLFGLSLLAMLPLGGGLLLVYMKEELSTYIIALVLAIVSLVLTACLVINFDLLYFVLNDNEQLSMFKALKFSMQLVKTHRRRYIYLLLSFTPMFLLLAISFGTAVFWIHPYMVQTITLFYLDVKGELDEVLERKQKDGPTPEPTMFNEYV